MKARYTLCFLLCALSVLLLACSQTDGNQLKDGYYTAEELSYNVHGWKEYITIYVSNNKIVTVEYNAKNPSGLIKSWDMDYMRVMGADSGTYPNKYTREYASDLLNKQSADNIAAISGATHSYHSFEALAKAVIEQAKRGDKSVVFVELANE